MNDVLIWLKLYSTGTFQATGYVKEMFLCRVVMGKQREQAYNLKIDADVVGTKLLFSKREIRFIQLNDGKAHPQKSTTQLTCQNVFVKPLYMKFLVKPPFECNKNDAKLEPTECLTLDLSLEWQTPTVKISTVVMSKFEVVYTDTVHRDTLNMIGEIHFPNLRLSTNKLNFE